MLSAMASFDWLELFYPLVMAGLAQNCEMNEWSYILAEASWERKHIRRWEIVCEK